jgi:hypothetical protein
MDNVIGALWFLEGSPGLWDDLMTERKGQVSRSGAPDGLGLSGYRAGWDGCIGQWAMILREHTWWIPFSLVHIIRAVAAVRPSFIAYMRHFAYVAMIMSSLLEESCTHGDVPTAWVYFT